MREWIVDAADAYTRWVEVQRPTAPHEFGVMLWLVELERNGPPAIIGQSPRGYAIARGPHDEEIEFSVLAAPLTGVAKPPWAIIMIYSIS